MTKFLNFRTCSIFLSAAPRSARESIVAHETDDRRLATAGAIIRDGNSFPENVLTSNPSSTTIS